MFQVIDDNNQELSPGKIGKIVVRVKPYRPVGLFSRYVVSINLTTEPNGINYAFFYRMTFS